MDLCKLCQKYFKLDDLNLVGSDVQIDLKGIAPLTSDSKICESCSKHIDERTRIKSILHNADERIREIYDGAMFRQYRPKNKGTKKKGKGSQVDRRLRTLSNINIKQENASSLGLKRYGRKPSFEHEYTEYRMPTIKLEATGKDKTNRCMNELESELWQDDVERAYNKENT